MIFTLYRSNVRGNRSNNYYPRGCNIRGEVTFKDAVSYDHTCGKFNKYRRLIDNFIESDCEVFDCDNGHSENPDDWITLEMCEELFASVAFAAAPSRNHMKQKGDISARPRFHVYFPHKLITSADDCKKLKTAVQKRFPFFDDNALDAARFIFGCPVDEVVWHEGGKTIDEYLDDLEFEDFDSESQNIHEGSRNSTMSRIAGRIIKRYGNTKEAHEIYMEKARLCTPPLPDEELNLIWRSALKFGKKVEKQDGYIPPEEYNKLYSLRPADFSDIGQAKVLAQMYEGEMAYTDATDYMRYDGTHWVESKQAAVGAAEDFLDEQLAEAKAAVETGRKALLGCGVSEDAVNAGGRTLEKSIDARSEKAFEEYSAALAYRTFVMKRRDMKYVTAALQAAKPMLLKEISDFDRNEFLLNTPDATYDLQKGLDGGREHAAEDYITKMTSVSPGREGRELWQSAVEEFFCGDTELIEYVQQIVGLSAIGKVYMEALIIAYGQGRNGKSTFWNAIAKVMGTYAGSISAEALTVGVKRNVKPEMAEIKGKRLIIAAELEEGMRLNTSVVKQLCSTDEISAEKKYKDPFKYTPTHTLVLYTNHLPRVGATDDGTWRRLIVIPFNAKIEPKDDVKNYADYLARKAGGAILSWIIEGAKKAIDRKFRMTLPRCVAEAVEKYHDANDWLSNFIEDCCEVDTSCTQKSGEFYQEYRAYCNRTGEYARSTSDFYAALDLAGYKKQHTRTGSMIFGIKIRSEFLDE